MFFRLILIISVSTSFAYGMKRSKSLNALNTLADSQPINFDLKPLPKSSSLDFKAAHEYVTLRSSTWELRGSIEKMSQDLDETKEQLDAIERLPTYIKAKLRKGLVSQMYFIKKEMKQLAALFKRKEFKRRQCLLDIHEHVEKNENMVFDDTIKSLDNMARLR